ncbi:MAG: pseudouridine synthase [Lactobacillales bacterium]|jgi:16S rRNA pseudouridine516 synthase|nr:pseudouridine synthase [Lactobacillales bacterium]
MRLDELLKFLGYGTKKEIHRLMKLKKVVIDEKPEYNGKRNVEPLLHKIEVNGTRIQTSPHVYYLLNKPSGVLTANSDENHQTVMDLLKEEDRREDLYSVGRLDRSTSGLLLLTNNGPLGYEMLHPTRHVTKRYRVEIKEALENSDILRFAEGIEFIGGVKVKPAKLEIIDGHHACVEISEGKFHQVKKMFFSVGKKVEKLQRIQFGPLLLEENLPLGAYRTLTQEELEKLRPYIK